MSDDSGAPPGQVTSTPRAASPKLSADEESGGSVASVKIMRSYDQVVADLFEAYRSRSEMARAQGADDILASLTERLQHLTGREVDSPLNEGELEQQRLYGEALRALVEARAEANQLRAVLTTNWVSDIMRSKAILEEAFRLARNQALPPDVRQSF